MNKIVMAKIKMETKSLKPGADDKCLNTVVSLIEDEYDESADFWMFDNIRPEDATEDEDFTNITTEELQAIIKSKLHLIDIVLSTPIKNQPMTTATYELITEGIDTLNDYDDEPVYDTSTITFDEARAIGYFNSWYDNLPDDIHKKLSYENRDNIDLSQTMDVPTYVDFALTVLHEKMLPED